MTTTDAPTITPDLAAQRLRVLGFTVRPHGIKWLIYQEGNPRRLTLSPDDLLLADQVAHLAGELLTIDALAELLYAETGEPTPGVQAPDPPGGWGYQSLLIRQIRRDGGTQARVGLDEDTVQDYAELMRDRVWDFQRLQRPIVLYDGSAFWLADGFHRIEAAQRAGLSDYPVEVLRGTQRDAILRAAGANADHGLRRTNADKRRAVELLLRDEEWRQWSDRKIADVCAVSDKTVAAIRRNLSAEIPQIATRTVERNGSTYQMTPAARVAGPITPELRDADGPWFKASKSASHPTAHHWNIRPSQNGNYVAACGITSSTLPATGADAGLCSVCAKHGDRRELVPIPAPAEQPAEHELVAQIRAQAAALGLGLIWEDDTVILHWPDEDIDQLMGMGYTDALHWLATEGAQQAEKRAAQQPPPDEHAEDLTRSATSDREAYEAQEAIDLILIGKAERAIERGDHDSARALLSQIGVATYRRDQLLAKLPASRLSLPIELQKRLVAAGAGIMSDGTVIAPQRANEPPAVLSGAEAEAALVRWAALPAETPAARSDWWNCGLSVRAIDRAINMHDRPTALTAAQELVRAFAGDSAVVLPVFASKDLPALMDSISFMLEMTAQWVPSSRERAAPALGLLKAVGRKALEVSE